MAQTTAHTIRIDDELWAKVTEKAAREKRSVSDVARSAFTHYTVGAMLTFTEEWGEESAKGSVFHMVNCRLEYKDGGFGVQVRPGVDGPNVRAVIARPRPDPVHLELNHVKSDQIEYHMFTADA